jgi:hypothetical protein
MKIAFYGSSLLSSYWNGAATYYRGLLRSWRGGHEVTFYEPDAFDRQQHRDIDPPDWARWWSIPRPRRRCATVMAEAAAADVVVKASGVGVFDDALIEGVMAPRGRTPSGSSGTSTRPPRWPRSRGCPTIRCAAPCRARLCADLWRRPAGRRRLRGLWAHGAAVPIYNALDPGDTSPGAARCALRRRPGLPRQPAAGPRGRVEQFFLEPAARLPDRRFLIGGNGWDDKAMPPNVRRIGHVYTARPQRLQRFAPGGAEHRPRQHGQTTASRRPRGSSRRRRRRLPDHRRLGGLELFLTEGEEVLVARDGQDVAEHLAALTPERARGSAKPPAARVLAEHTYARRAAEVDALLRRHAAAGQARKEPRMTLPLKIVVLGLSLSSSWGNGHATTYRALLRAFAGAATMCCSWSVTYPGTRPTAICRTRTSAAWPLPPRLRSEAPLAGRDRPGRRGDRRLLRAGRRRGRSLGAGDRRRRHRLLRHRHAR